MKFGHGGVMVVVGLIGVPTNLQRGMDRCLVSN